MGWIEWGGPTLNWSSSGLSECSAIRLVRLLSINKIFVELLMLGWCLCCSNFDSISMVKSGSFFPFDLLDVGAKVGGR